MPKMSKLPNQLFHGSKHSALDRLQLRYADTNLPLGRGIYLTAEERVAHCYAKGAGQVYQVKTLLPTDRVVNLDAPWSAQTPAARSAVMRALGRLGQTGLRCASAPVATEFERLSVTDDMRNAILAEMGIWMVFGVIDPTLHSGLQDAGVQYVVLVEHAIQLIHDAPRPET